MREPGDSVEVELKRISFGGGLRVYPLYAGPTEFVRGPENVERLWSVLDRKAATLERAGGAGFETHLVLLQWALGETEHWKGLLRERPPADHPQFLWVVDFFPAPPSLTRLLPPSA